MALQIFNTDGSQQDSWSASFTLQGTPEQGQLDIFSPLGAQLALLQWSPAGALLRQGRQEVSSASLADLVERSLGTDLPIHAFFAWLQGQPHDAEGWQADLAQYAQGRIRAQRLQPLPQAQLKIILQPPATP